MEEEGCVRRVVDVCARLGRAREGERELLCYFVCNAPPSTDGRFRLARGESESGASSGDRISNLFGTVATGL